MVIQVTTGRGKPGCQNHANAPAKLLRKVQPELRLANEGNGNKCIVHQHTHRILIQTKIEINQFPHRGTHALLIARPTMIKQVLERRFIPVRMD